MRYARLVAAAALTGQVGCGSTPARSPGGTQSPAPATVGPAATSPAPSAATPGIQPGGPAQVCSPAGTYLTAVRTGEHSGYDRVVFQFSGNCPLTSPDRLVIDVSHVALGKFPGIWDITSWPQYWAAQYSWLNGHQPWLSSPSAVVQVWAGGIGSASVVRQVSANTFKVIKPDGKTFTVTGVRPVSVPGPWVITKIA